jgi:hypothetical protein
MNQSAITAGFIDCIYVPIPDEVDNYLKIGFPRQLVTQEELVNIKNPEIVASLGTIADVFKLPEIGTITDEYNVKSMDTAIAHYGIIIDRAKGQP